MQSKVDDLQDVKSLFESIDQDMRTLTGKMARLKSKRRWNIPGSLIPAEENFAEIPETRWKPRTHELLQSPRDEDIMPSVTRIRAKLASLAIIRPRTDFSRIFKPEKSLVITPEDFTLAVRCKLRISKLAEPDDELVKFFRYLDKDRKGSIPVEELVEFILSAIDIEP